MSKPIARAVIVDEDRVLLARMMGDRYVLPGGELQVGKPINGTLERHTLEQTGYEVHVGGLLWVLERNMGDNTVELVYRATLREAAVAVPHPGGPDQVGVEWVGREQITELEFVPRSLVQPLVAYLTARSVTPPIYLTEIS